MISTRRSCLVSALARLVGAGAISACALVSATAADGPIKIGVLQSITGSLAFIGIPERQAIEIAIDDINAAGGVNGRQLQAVVYDPAGDTGKAVQLAQRLISQDKVDVVVGGGSSSGIALAIKPILERAGVFFMSTESAAPIVEPASRSPLAFSTVFSSNVVARATLKYLQSRKMAKIGLLADTSAFGAAGVASFQEVAGDYGIAVVAVSYDPATTDLSPQLAQLQGHGVKAYVNWTTSPSGVIFMNNIAAMKLPEDVVIMQSYGYSNPTLMQQAGAAARGVRISGAKASIAAKLPDSDPQKAGLLALDAAMKKKFGSVVSIYASQSYDAMMVTAEGLRKARGAGGAAIAKAIEGLGSYEGTQGAYRFSAEDHRGLSDSVPITFRWGADGFEPLPAGE
ncbi:MAG TPA: ABC transporter substrate-binding protein [Rhodoblastus sp.]|nr:ABC transporter substrate-binding protein [Rhodoblastus sp.]